MSELYKVLTLSRINAHGFNGAYIGLNQVNI